MPQGDQQRHYITTLNIVHDAGSIEEAQQQAEQMISGCTKGGYLLTGHTDLMREDKPMETVSYGSSKPFRNRLGAFEDTLIGQPVTDTDRFLAGSGAQSR